MQEQDEFIPTRHSLLSRLKDWDDDKSWSEFFDTYWKLIYSVAARSGLSDAAAQDVVQETVVSVAKKMHEFKYDPAVGSFKNWLLLVTRRRIADHLRKHYRQVNIAEPAPKEGSATAQAEKLADPALPILDQIWDEEWRKNLMDAAIRRVKGQVKAKQWQMFDFYVLREWPITKVASVLKVNVGQVYLAKHRVSRLIRKQLQDLEKRMV